MMPMPTVTASTLVSTDAKTLPLKRARVSCRAGGGISRVVLEQTFANPHAEPLHVTYTFPLPAEAAVSGFRFKIGDRIVVGEIDKKQAARERFEEAVLAGQTAALLEEDRSSLFTQEIGNVPPGAEVVVEITLDQKLRWLDEGMWEWRFPLAAAPRYLGKPGRTADAKKIAFDVAEQLPVRASLSMLVTDAITNGRSPESPSHALSCAASAQGFGVELGGGNSAPLDRDVVVQWPVAAAKVGVACEIAGPRAGTFEHAHALFTVVPPQKSARAVTMKRDVTFLLDTSGSMGGAPIEQAKRIVLAMLDGLGDADRFELIEFSNAPRRFQNGFSNGTKMEKAGASAWVRSLRASGGTEMRDGIYEALKPSGERKRADAAAQVVLITDGLIGFEQEIVDTILKLLPGDARLHTVGVGSSVNRSLTGPAARAGRGIEVVLGLSEDPERAAQRLRARSDAPLVVDVVASGDALVDTAPVKIPDLFAGAPVLLSARVRAEGGEIVLRGKCGEGAWEERVIVKSVEIGSGNDAVIALYGREAVEDMEMQIAAGQNKTFLDSKIEAAGLAYRISTRLTSWVAIDTTLSVDPRDPSRRVTVPQALAHGTSAEGLGLRSAMPMAAPFAPPMGMANAPTLAGGYGGPPPPARARYSAVRPHKPGPRQGTGAPPPPAPAAPRAIAPREQAEADEETQELRRDDALASPKKKEAPPSEPVTKTLAQRVKDFFAPAAEKRPRIRARVVLHKNGELVVELTTPVDLEWKTDTLRIVLADGSTAPAAVDESRTTRNGSISAGSTIRLALRYAASFAIDDVLAIEVVLASGAIDLELDR